MTSTVRTVVILLVFARTAQSLLGTAGAATALAAALYGAWTNKCELIECCSDSWVERNAAKFDQLFDANVFGQPFVKSIVSGALRSHLRKGEPSKALLLSFHGWTGGGKTFVSKQIAQTLFKNGMKSNYVHLFLPSLHFPNPEESGRYRRDLQNWIKGNTTICPQSLFIFDEVDHFPEGVIDSILPFVDHHDQVDGIDFRQAIFILLSNSGGREITKVAYEKWRDGLRRDHLDVSDFSAVVRGGAFNEDGGLHKSEVIKRHLPDHYVPFLPLGKSHVMKCIEAAVDEQLGQVMSALDPEKEGYEHWRAQLREIKLNLFQVEEESGKNAIETLADSLDYWPADTRIYCTTGCKRVGSLVGVLLEEMLNAAEFPEPEARDKSFGDSAKAFLRAKTGSAMGWLGDKFSWARQSSGL